MPKDITAIIVDDEDGNREFLAGLLQIYCPWVKLVGQADNVVNGLKIIEEMQPNLLFLDIRMPKGSGFELLDQLETKQDLQVIFVTAHDQYAVKAFRYSAQDYLLKPIRPTQLKESVLRVSQEKEKMEQIERINHINNLINQEQTQPSSIIIRSTSGQTKINIDDIARCEADSNYTLIFTLKEQRPIIATKSLKEFDELLAPFDFFRVHQSHLINLRFFSKYVRNKDASGGKVYLTNGDNVEVSRSKKKKLLQRIYI